jgi:hypothetical protein
MSLIAELKRRNVFRVGVAYAIVATLKRAYSSENDSTQDVTQNRCGMMWDRCHASPKLPVNTSL